MLLGFVCLFTSQQSFLVYSFCKRQESEPAGHEGLQSLRYPAIKQNKIFKNDLLLLE